jgi:energy-coupling factor transport system ATP-binding protein
VRLGSNGDVRSPPTAIPVEAASGQGAAPEPRPLGVEAIGFGWTYRGRARPALQGISFRLEPGQLLLVLGPSGSGKSTLARALSGIVPHALPGVWQGELRVGGEEVPSTAPAVLGERVGIVFQDPDSQIVMPGVEDEVAFGLENRGWPRARMVRRVPEALAEVGLAGFQARSTGRLSGGERQRLALADVLAAAPGLVALDEPTANLDPVGMAGVFDSLKALALDARRTVVVIEHRLEAALPLADVVLLLDDQGRQIRFGPPDEVGPREARRLYAVGGWVPAGWSQDPEPDPEPGTGHVPEAPIARIAGRPWPIVEARGLAVHYPAEQADQVRVGLAGIGLAVRASERVGLVGPNGSGKSTLLAALAGLRRPDRGQVLVGTGLEAPADDPARLPSIELPDRIALVFQDPEIGFIARTVLAEVMAGPGPVDAQTPDREAAGRSVLARFGLGALADEDPFRISQGEQRRLSLAAVAMRAPALLLLDEPTFGLDRRGSQRVVAMLDEGRSRGQAQVLATHDPRLLPACDRVVALDRGRVVFDGGSADFLADPPFRPAAPWRAAT